VQSLSGKDIQIHKDKQGWHYIAYDNTIQNAILVCNNLNNNLNNNMDNKCSK